jgi:plastocyanin
MRYRIRLRRRQFVSLAAGAVMLIGCGGAADDAPSTPSVPPSPAATTVTAESGTPPGLRPTEGAPAVADSALVLVKGFLFQPDAIRLPAGTTVTWENSDQILHTATAGVPDAASGLFDGQMNGADTSFSHTFDTPGTFVFFCSRHPHMRGEVTVH